jgi:DNA-binding Lrp family transcriptional regulator
VLSAPVPAAAGEAPGGSERPVRTLCLSWTWALGPDEQQGAHRPGDPEIPFAAATTGPTNLVASAVFRDTRHLYEYLTGELAALPGVSSVQTAPIIATFKRTGSVH